MDSAGNIYAADAGTKTLYRFNASGTQTLAIPPTNATPNFSALFGIAVDGAGNIYAADDGTKTLYRFNASGTQTLAIPHQRHPQPLGPGGDRGGRCREHLRLRRHHQDLVPVQCQRHPDPGHPPTSATPNLVTPEGIAVDSAGNIYASDTTTSTLYRFCTTNAALAPTPTPVTPKFTG